MCAYIPFPHCENLIIESITFDSVAITAKRGGLGVSTCSEVSERCLMPGDCSPYLAGKNGWVICDVCHSWYHSVCVGVATTITSQDCYHFTCCLPPKENEVYVY